MIGKIYSATGRLWHLLQQFYDTYHASAPYIVAAMAVSMGSMLWALLQTRWGMGISPEEITSVQALMLLCLWSMAIMAQRRSLMGFALGVTVMLVMSMGVGDWMVAQSDVQTAFDTRASVMQIMVISVGIGILVYTNRGLLLACRNRSHA